MPLRRLQVTDFRCLQLAEFDFDPQFTLISGANASGKTSLLEAIYVLGRGRSFRTRRLDNLIRRGKQHFVVFGEVDALQRIVPVGVEGSEFGIRAKVGGDKVNSLAELAPLLPVQIIDPEIHRLIEEGPSQRRRFLDWGVFHVEPKFIGDWQRYQQTLRQRNAALKSRAAPAVVEAWNVDFERFGEMLTASRQRYVQALCVQAAAITHNLLGQELRLGYRTGWSRDHSLGEALRQSLSHDIDSGSTQVGPHRADLSIWLDGVTVKDRISRGQQKLLATALLLAQIKLIPQESLARPTLLLDDPAAELDDDKLMELIREVSSHQVQLVVTTLNPEFTEFGRPAVHHRMAQ